MPTNLPSTTFRLADLIGRGLLALYLTVLVAVCGLLIVYGPSM